MNNKVSKYFQLGVLKSAMVCISVVLMASSFNVMAAGGAHVEHSGANINDTASLQRGAKWYVNYCLGCHSLSYQRYNRLAKDLQLSEEEVMQNLVFF